MTGALRIRGELPFEEAEEGLLLRFRNSDLAELEQELGTNWFQRTVEQFLKGDLKIDEMGRLARLGVKRRNPQGKLETLAEDEMRELLEDIPLIPLAEKLFDALTVAMSGKLAKEYVEEQIRDFEAAVASGDPDPSPFRPDTVSSQTSEEGVSGQESE